MYKIVLVLGVQNINIWKIRTAYINKCKFKKKYENLLCKAFKKSLPFLFWYVSMTLKHSWKREKKTRKWKHSQDSFFSGGEAKK